MKTVTLCEVLKTSYRAFTQNFFKLLGIGLILSIPSIPQNVFGITFDGPLVIIEVFLGLLQLFLTIGSNLYLLDLLRSKPHSFHSFIRFETIKIFPRVLLQYLSIILILLPALMLFVGSLIYISGAAKSEVFIVPTTMTTMILAASLFVLSLGLLAFLGMSFFMSTYLVLEKKGLITNIKESWRITQGKRFKIFVIIAGFSLLGATLNALNLFIPPLFSVIPTLISLLIILPFMSLTLVTYYNKLVSLSEGEISCQK